LGVTRTGGGFLKVKGIISQLLNSLNGSGRAYSFKEASRDSFDNCAEVFYNGACLGFLGKLNSTIRKKWALKEEVYYAQLDMKGLMHNRREKIFVPFSRLPAVYRDISIALKKEQKFKIIEDIIACGDTPYLSEYKIIDVYEESQKNSAMFTLRIFYHSAERTLTSEEVDAIHTSLREKISQLQGVTLR
jgi:phenylalanyl-tRNA synthetase beta chain